MYHSQYVSETDAQIKDLVKVNKIKEKEVYNTKKRLANCRDTLSNTKLEMSKLKVQKSKMEGESNRLNRKLKK